jgi:nucleotide-binding universal stress UspA family protein
MPALQSILVPVDGSGPSLAALEHAIALAEDLGANLQVLSVEVPDDLSDTTMSPTTRIEIDRSMKEAMATAIADARTLLGDRLSTRTEAGDPLRTIVNIANEGHCDLIVIGTYGRIGRLHAMLGSVAEGVIRNAPCPVLIVRQAGSGYQSFAERRHHRPTLAEQSAHRH